MDKPEQKTDFLILPIMGTPRTLTQADTLGRFYLKPLIDDQVSWN